MCGKDTSPSPFIPLYSTVAVDKATESSPTQAESDIELAKSRYCDAATRTLPTSIFDLDLPLVTTREENEFRLAMMEKMRQAAYRGIEAEFKVPVVSARMEFDTSESIGVVNVSQVKPATNEELGLKFDSTKASDADPADIPDAEHPYQDETIYFTPEGQSIELPIDYRWKTLQVPDSDCPWGGTKPPPMPPVESDAMPEGESPIARDGICVRIKILESRFDELLKGVQAYNEKIADLISDVEFLKEDNSALTGKLYQHDSVLALLGKELADLRKASETKTGCVNVEGGQSPMGVLFVDGEPIVGYDHPFPQPSFPAGQPGNAAIPTRIADASDAHEHINPTLDPSKIHPHRFIAHDGLVIDTALNREHQSNDAEFEARALNAGELRAFRTSSRVDSQTYEHQRAIEHVDWIVCREGVPLYRAMEYILLGGEMFDPVSFDLNSYLKGESKSKPLDRTQSLCIAIEWLRVALRDRIWDARREAERESGGESD